MDPNQQPDNQNNVPPTGQPPEQPYGQQSAPQPVQPVVQQSYQPAGQQPTGPDGQPQYQPQAATYAQPATGTNGLAIAGLVTAFFFPLVGLVLSIVALAQIKKKGQGGKGVAIAGII